MLSAKSLQSCPTLCDPRVGCRPTRLPGPWDSPGKNTGVGCHFLLQCMKVKSESEVAQSYLTLSDPMDCSLPGSSSMGFSRQEYWSGVPLPSPFKTAGFIYSFLHATSCLIKIRKKILQIIVKKSEITLKTAKCKTAL